MTRILVLGYGNTLRGDDALGPRAVERLRPLVFPAETLACHQLIPELAAQLAEYDAAIFVDAAAAGEPGTVHVRRLLPETQTASLTHHVSPATLLAMAHELYGRAPQSLLVTAVGADFTLQSSDEGPLSAAATRALDEICRLLPQLVRDFPVGW
ncbi:MAG: hydrogenase maturation protease [Acidobacteriota bacterium]|nr:hydrogenase maturation protease [Acidobacteriota bacterium]